ncbi:histidinol dehydrogenase [bacterium]|nr:histidinol dehydrogenase [bacterium]
MQHALFTLPDDAEALEARLARRRDLFDRSLLSDVALIFDDVAARGDQAILAATARFDGVDSDSIRLSREAMEALTAGIPAELRAAIEIGVRHVTEVNEAILPEPMWERTIRPGTVIGEKATPLDAVGLWVPARKGPLVSTAVMLAAAARVAGVPRIVVGMPPLADGTADPGTVAAAFLSGAHEFVLGNGVAIIAGMSIGTESVPEVDGIFGPGPGAIAAAMATAFSYGKRTVVGLGPTDGLVLADDSADPGLVAWDLMTEAEHGPDSVTVLVTTSAELAERTLEEMAKRLPDVPDERRRVLETVYGPQGMGSVVVAPDLESACDVVNDFAAEHLIIACNDETARQALGLIRHAGEVLLGHHTPFSAANYGIGITAVLPTSGFARVFSGVTCRDMMKFSTIGSLDEHALRKLWPMIRALGDHEGLPCHVQSAKARLRPNPDVE